MGARAEARPDRLAVVGVALALAGAAGLGAIAWVAGDGRDRTYVVALAALLGVPGITAAIGLHRRPMVVIVAGALLLPLSCISLAGVALPLLVPAGLLLAGGARRDRALAGPVPGRELAAAGCVVAFAFLGFVLLLTAPRHEVVHYGTTYATTNTGSTVAYEGQTETNDEVAARDALLPIAFVAAAITAPLLVPPRARQRSSASV
jgi:hypothetical protein